MRVFNSKMEPIAVHVQIEPGTFQTQDPHLHAQKISQVEQGTVSLLRRAALLGTHVEQWARHMLEVRGIQGVRVLLGLWIGRVTGVSGRFPWARLSKTRNGIVVRVLIRRDHAKGNLRLSR